MRPDLTGEVLSLAVPPNFPRPRPDELLYSVIARSAVHVGTWSPKQLLEALYGHRGTLAVPDLPSSLARLAGLRAAWGMTVEELAFRHTLLPYYTHFLHPSERTRVLEAMLGRCGHLHLRLGICASGVARIPFFRLCPACTEEDLAQSGETYWRRTHHLPGVVVCALHGEVLLETNVPYRPIGRHEHIGAHPRLLARATPVLAGFGNHNVALAITRRSDALLTPAEGTAVPDYRAELRRLGFVGRHGGSARLQAAVRAVIPPALLGSMFVSVTEQGSLHWLDQMRRKPRRVLHPLKHIFTRVVLEAVSKSETEHRCEVDGSDLNRGRRARIAHSAPSRPQALALAAAGLSAYAIARELGIAWKTAHRLLEAPVLKSPAPASNTEVASDQAAWTALRAASPAATRTELRRSARALYARLYRADRAWLLAQPCPRYSRRPASRIDWERRDRELAGRVSTVIEQIRARTPPVRASRHRVLGELQVRSLLALRGAKLTRTRAILAERCESVAAFQLRRLARVLEARPADARLLGDFALLRAARINPDRLADRGAALLETARRGCR